MLLIIFNFSFFKKNTLYIYVYICISLCMNKPEIVKNLKKLLDQVGFTQVWAAKKLEISPVYLNRVINGDKVPSDDLTMRMMELSATLESCGLVSVV